MAMLVLRAQPGGLGRAQCIRIAARKRAVRVSSTAGSRAEGDGVMPQVAPLAPTSDTGIQLHSLLAYPSLRATGKFDATLSAHLEVIAADQDAEMILMQRDSSAPPMSPADDALRLRLMELRRGQRKNATSDAVYACAVHKLQLVGVPMSGRTSPDDGREHAAVLLAIHGADASKMIEVYIGAAVDGLSMGGSKLPDDAVVRVAKAQLAQSYYAALMLGYYLRAVAFRYRLDCQLGTLPPGIGADVAEAKSNPPFVAILRKLATAGRSKMARNERIFAAYVEHCQLVLASADALDAELSADVRELMLRQTGALFGDVSRLHLEFQDTFGDALLAAKDEAAIAAVAARVKADLSSQRLPSSTLRVARLRHLVREAAALGALLRDVEAYVRSFGLLL